MTQNRPVALVTGASSGIGHVGFPRARSRRGSTSSEPAAIRTESDIAHDGVFLMDLDVTSDESVDLVGQAGDRAVRAHRRPGQQRRRWRHRGAAEENSVAQDAGRSSTSTSSASCG